MAARFNDEIGAHDGITFWLTRTGPLDKHRDCECPFCGYEKARNAALEIKVLWEGGEYTWEFVTKAPHATFEITDEGEKFCRGIVLHLDDIQPF